MTGAASFHPTQWTLVLRARGESAEAKAALSDLCAAYYAPVIAFLRREGREEDAARETAHAFFATLLEDGVGAPDKERGRFRSYLLAALKHFLTKQRTAAAAEKRGSGAVLVPLVTETDTSPGLPLPAAPESTPELIFDREWAFTLIARALATLESEHAHRAEYFATLKPWLDGTPGIPQSQAAERLAMSDTALKVAIHRLRVRFRELIRAEVAATVHDPADTGGELKHLVAIVTA
jgi:DNA-directed RNA polymerase specialized sigma24 family protein